MPYPEIQFQGENMEHKPLRRLTIDRIYSDLVYNSTCCITASEATITLLLLELCQLINHVRVRYVHVEIILPAPLK